MKLLFMGPALGAMLGLLAACANGEDLCASGNRLAVERPELKAALLEDLSSSNVAFQVSNTGEVCYPAKETDFVRARLIALDLEQLPANEITVPGGEFGQRTLQRLTDAGIQYSHSMSDGDLVLVVEKQDLEKVRAITFSVAQSIARGE